jgi:RND family efflux transporter MFP subunit
MKRIASIVFTVALASCGRGHKPPATPDLPAASVKTTVVAAQKLPDLHEVVGTVRPTLSANVSPKVMATIQKIHVKPGDAVTNGQSLAELDDRDLRAEYDRAKADFERFSALVEKGVATRAEFDATQSRFKIAEANLSYAKLNAPFAGIVAQKLCDVGDLATPGKMLFVIEQPTQFRLEANAPERFAGNLAIGQTVAVVIDALGGHCTGPIDEIIPAADPASRSFLIKINLKGDKPLKSGLFGRASLPVGERTTLVVPKTAVRERGQLTFVFVVTGGRAQMRLIRTGKDTTDGIEVLSGVAAGEAVVVEGEVADGQRIQ